MRLLLTIMLSVAAMAASAQDADTATAFLDKFEAFVESIENNDSTIDWQESNATYKALRTEYQQTHKGKMSDSELARYTKLKARYVKQVSLKKVGKSIGKKASAISSTVKGAVEGMLGK